MNMFRVESYVAPILLSYVDKYVQNFNPANAQLSIWSGDVVLQNLVLKTEVLQHELSLPFTLVSGRIHELHIHIPWTKLVVEPIIVTINTMECILTLNGNQILREAPVPESMRSTPMEAPPGYMQALVRRIVSNISLRVQHLIVKYVHDDIVLSLNINDMAIDSAGPNWKPAFADIDPAQPLVRRVMHVEELTLCLDRTEADGKIRIFQEPLLCRCSLDFRVLTRLVSASSRRASSVSVQLWSRRLAWSVNSEQLVLLLRLLREQPEHVDSTPLGQSSTDQVQTNEGSSDPSWTQWAWSWVPTWLDSATDLHEQPLSPTPCPFNISVFIDEIILNFKILSPEINNRRNADSILELISSHVAVKWLLCNPTFQSIKIGVRSTELRSQGACVCGHIRTRYADNSRTQTTVYLHKLPSESSDSNETWSWPEDAYDMGDADVAEIIDEGFRATPEPEGTSSTMIQEQTEGGVPDGPANTPPSLQPNEIDLLFKTMGPLIYIEYSRERSPQNDFTNPYDNPPQDFEYSDWTEECNLKMNVEPIELRLCMSLYHRLNAIKSIIDGAPTSPEPEVQVNVLTVEECDALQTNLPQRRINMDLRNMRIRIIPWDHSLTEASRDSPLVLVLDVPKAIINFTCPLYPQRVCAAACQLPTDNNPLYQAARINILTNNIGIEAKICSDSDTQTRPCGRMNIRVAMHFLLHKHLFQSDVITHAVTVKIGELNVCGSMARLSAAYHVVDSNIRKQTALPLKYTTLAKDALNDEEAVAIDINIEDIAMRGFLTKNSYTFISTLQSARATAFQALNNHAVKQAWIFSAPDSPSATSYFRLALQWCNPVTIKSLDYTGVWIESTSVSMDPLFVSWLAYEPRVNEEYLARSKQTQSSTILRRPTPSSSSGRGASRSASVTELVHAPSHSRDSHSEPDKKERDEKKPQPQEAWWSGARLVLLYKRLRNTLFNVEVGLVLLYATDSSASAVDCVTLRDAMERHVVKGEKVVVFCVGRLSLSSNMMMKFLWSEIRHDGPTYLVLSDTNAQKPETFPWKVLLSDMSCYLLEVYATRKLRDIKAASVSPKTMLELVTSTLTLSVITKRQELKTKHERKRPATGDTSKQDHLDQIKMKYFTSGTNFKPSNLKDFVRGPKRGKSDSDESEHGASPDEKKVIEGPVVSIGVHIHIDTPPINVKLNRNELNMVNAMCHLMCHVVSLLSRPRMVDPRPPAAPQEGHRSVGIAADDTQMDDIQSQSTLTEPNPLVSIYEAKPIEQISEIKSFLWLQWVISRATAVVDTYFMKLALEMDDIITSVDLQKHYSQMKFKISSASLRHYKSDAKTDNWVLGALGGRILEVREPNNALDNHDFFSVTLTKASIESIQPNMREDLHPKLLQNEEAGASVTEIFATLAPLEAVLLPTVCANIFAVLREVSKRSYCPLTENSPHQSVNAAEATQWPFAYFNFGGMRVLLTDEDEVNQDSIFDDAIIFNIERATLTPHPENPISRRLINLSNENLWKSAGRQHEGRQYELILKSISVQSSQFAQIVEQAERVAEVRRSVAGENPAYNWSRHRAAPTYTHVLDPLDASVAFAPALFADGALCCGPALEVNFLSRCVARVSLEHITIVTNLFTYLSEVYNKYFFLGDPCYIREKVNRPCPFITLLKRHLPPPQLDNTQAGSEMYAPVVIGTANYSVHCPIHHRPMPPKRETDSGAGTESNTDNETESLLPRRCQLNRSKSIGEHTQVNPWNYVEIYMSMSTINLALYTRDDSSHEAIHLRVPKKYYNAPEPIVEDEDVTPEEEESKEELEKLERIKRSSLDAYEKDPDVENNMIEDNQEEKDEDEFVQDTQDVTRTHRDSVENVRATRTEEKAQESIPKENHVYIKLPLLHMKLEEQNMYYWRSNTQINLKMSLFDVRLALAGGTDDGAWNDVILSTKKGEAESDTEIPPGVASLNILVPVAGKNTSDSGSITGANTAQLNRGSIHLDLERPTMIEVSEEKLVRMGRVIDLINQRMSPSRQAGPTGQVSAPFLNKLREFMMNRSVESITVRSTQIGLRGSEGAIGCTYSSLHIANCTRPERMTGRGLLRGLVVSSGAPFKPRHVILQPTILGCEWEAKWKLWQSADSEVALSACVALDRAVFDVRPEDLDALGRIIRTAAQLSAQVSERRKKAFQTPLFQQNDEPQSSDLLPTDLGDHYYKDDLRSGAFQLVRGARTPLAYQVMLHHATVTWQYPHPRAITTLVAYPLPDLEEDVACVLELFNDLSRKWEGHTRFTIPTGVQAEYYVAVSSMGVYCDAVYATLWRVRVLCNEEDDIPKSESEDFDFRRYLSTDDSQDSQKLNEKVERETSRGASAKVTGDLLSGVLRVDSHFAPNNLPRLKIGLKAALVELNVHNALPCTDISDGDESVKGYYISEPLVRSHRTLAVIARDTSTNLHCAAHCRGLFNVTTHISGEILNCESGTMETCLKEVRVQAGATLPLWDSSRSLRVRLSDVKLSFNLIALKTVQTLFEDWRPCIYSFSKSQVTPTLRFEECSSSSELSSRLEGRVFMWIHNTCSSELRFGQVDTTETVALEPHCKIAYRWCSPSATKKLRFTIVDPTDEKKWSDGVSLKPGESRVVLRGMETLAARSDVHLLVTVEDKGAMRHVTLAGRIVLANLLYMNVSYKVRVRPSESQSWYNVTGGRLAPETLDTSILCGTDTEAVLKIKVASGDNGWSGDIPFKESPKEHIPWLIKLPRDGDTPITLWCRVVRLRADSRVLVSLWPLYMLRSYLTLDAEVLIKTDSEPSTSSANASENSLPPSKPPEMMPVSGQGTTAQLFMCGSVNSKYTLSFKYKNVARSVTTDVPLHYGTTSPSVFELVTPFNSIEDLIDDIQKWILRSGRQGDPKWPLSAVSSHWPQRWTPGAKQPRSDVVVRYVPVRVANGCSLELHVAPLVMVCNAAAPALSIFDADGRYVCRVLPGTVISPPTTILKEPFHICLNRLANLTYSGLPLRVWDREPGQYGRPPLGCIALDYDNEIALIDKNKVRLVTIIYEFKENINIFGITHTYAIINKLEIPILMGAVVIPQDSNKLHVLTAPTYVNIEPVRCGGGEPIEWFSLEGKWPGPGTDPSELIPYVLLTSHWAAYHARLPVPVRLSGGPLRQPIAVHHTKGKAFPAVVSVVSSESRWLVTVERDPCPQFVVHNHTLFDLVVAETKVTQATEPSTSAAEPLPEHVGVQWWCTVEAKSYTPFSTPTFAGRYPSKQNEQYKDSGTYLSFAKISCVKDDMEMRTPRYLSSLKWSPPAAVTNGEQLMQLGTGQLIKMRVLIHLHSSLIELREVNQKDISASEIRRRIFETDAEDKLQRLGGRHDVLLKETSAESPSEDDATCLTPLDSKTKSSVSLITPKGTERLEDGNVWLSSPQFLSERLRVIATGLVLQMAASPDAQPLLAIHLDRPTLHLQEDADGYKVTASVSNFQVDNLQYEGGQFDFPVVLSTCAAEGHGEPWPLLWNMFIDSNVESNENEPSLLLTTHHQRWAAVEEYYCQLSNVEARFGPISLYVEDPFVSALLELAQRLTARADSAAPEHTPSVRHPLLLQTLLIHPLDLQLTLHTALRMYIALDQSPLRLNAFECHNLMTSPDRLVHSFTVHYLSAALLSAGWVVGGLELLGAPGALAARVSAASGGVRGVASAAAAALLKSVSAWAGSLARNLDLLAGDQEHARRAAAARRRPPPNLVAGLGAGVANFAINLLGAIGGLAHHPVVGVAVGDNDSTTGLRRGLVGALAKPLSATADLFAYAGHGLLQQTGWDLLPSRRPSSPTVASDGERWRRECVRLCFQLGGAPLVAGFDVQVNGVRLYLLLTHKYMVLVEPETDRFREMIDVKTLELTPYTHGRPVKLSLREEITKEKEKEEEGASQSDEEEQARQMSATALERVARYTGAETSTGGRRRKRAIELRPAAGQAAALHTTLSALIQHTTDTHFPLL